MSVKYVQNDYQSAISRSGGKKVIAPTWDNWDDFIDQVEQPISQPTQLGFHSDLRTQSIPNALGSGTDYFGGIGSLAECVRYAREGWKHGREKLLTLRGKLDKVISGGQFLPEMTFAECGEDVDVGRFIGGIPENMIDWQLREYKGGKGGRTVKLLVNVTSSASIMSDAAFFRGAIAMAFSDVLESYGYRVEVWIGEVGIQNPANTNIYVRACIKSASQPFDVDRIAFATSHPAVQRRLFFRIYEQQKTQDWEVATWHYGAGGSFNDPDPEIIEYGYLWHSNQGGNIEGDGFKTEFQNMLTRFGLQMEAA